jgi:hypothetical protein
MRAKAKMFVPCAKLGNNRCPGTMHLQYLEDPEFYKCDRYGCHFNDPENGVVAEQVNWIGYIRGDDDNRGKRKTGDDAPTAEQMETMV